MWKFTLEGCRSLRIYIFLNRKYIYINNICIKRTVYRHLCFSGWEKWSEVELCDVIASSKTIKTLINQSTLRHSTYTYTCTSIVVAEMDGFKKKNVIIFPSFSGNKLNIYCIYIKNYTQSSREMLMSLLLRRTER